MNLIILGPQGSGKGTQAEMLAQKFNLEHIDMGKFLREVAKMDTPLGREVYEIQNIRVGALVPSRILQEVFTVKLSSIPREQGIVFDGFPRNVDQMGYLEKAVTEFGRQIDALVYIKLKQEESIKRIAKRVVCDKCKTVYILGKDLNSQKEKCKKCEGKIIQREDDTEEGILKRLATFEKETVPVIESYRKQNKVIEINGEQTIADVFKEILEKLKDIE